MFPRCGWGSCVWSILLTHWVCRFMCAALKQADKEKSPATFLKADTAWDWVQCSGVWGGFPQIRGLGCCRVRFWLMLYLLLIERGQKRVGGETARTFFPRADMPCWLCHTRIFLAVRCN
jgi:hypothetical protein